jgi:hypothetical protein
MPPVSVTMHPVKLPVVDPLAVLDAAAELDELAELDAGLLVLLAVDELLPHAAISSAVAAAATVAANEVCFIRFLHWTSVPTPGYGQGVPLHRLPGDYFVGVSSGRGRARLRPPRCQIATRLSASLRFSRATGRWPDPEPVTGCLCAELSALLLK